MSDDARAACTPNDNLHQELAEHLAELDASAPSVSDPYRVERVIKETPAEATQLVWYRGADGSELGPFIRKFLAESEGLGGAYREVFAVQRAGKRLHHLPRIVECRELSRSQASGVMPTALVQDRCLLVVMEFIPGCTLREVVTQARASQRMALTNRLMPKLCEAVEELHESFAAPIIHRDLTPGNIICPEGDPASPVLIDLGIARTWREGATADTTHFGTRAYAPPEQFGFGQTDVRSDVYALGMLAFFCLTGRDPSPADRSVEFAASGVPEPWRRVIARAAAFDPSDRYSGVRSFAEACARACGESERDEASIGGAATGADQAASGTCRVATGADRAASGAVLGTGVAGDKGSNSIIGVSPAAASEPIAPSAGRRVTGDPAHAHPGASAGSGLAPAAPAGAKGTAAVVVGTLAASVADRASGAVGSAAHRASGEGPRLPGLGGKPPRVSTAGNPATSSTPASTSQGSWFARFRQRVLAVASLVPEWVGRIWNTCLLVLYALVLAGCWYAFADPLPQDAADPTWQLAFEYLVFCPIFFGTYLYAMLDRRRLRRRFASLGRISVMREWLVCLGVMLLSVVVLAVVLMVASAV